MPCAGFAAKDPTRSVPYFGSSSVNTRESGAFTAKLQTLNARFAPILPSSRAAVSASRIALMSALVTLARGSFR